VEDDFTDGLPRRVTDKATEKTIELVTRAMLARRTSLEEIVDVVAQIFPNLEFRTNGDGDTILWRHRESASQ